MTENAPLFIEYAPMEGVTRAIYRQRHRAMFSGVDRYYAPFLSPSGDGCFSEKELREVRPENNAGTPLVPQLLTGRSEHFAWAAEVLAELGYSVVNLNLGCPSGTVVTKHKGAGALRDVSELDRLMAGCVRACEKTGLRLSVKTRIGWESPGEFPAILAVLCRYPLEELILHPRVRAQFYGGAVCREAIGLALEQSPAPVCVSGDLFSPGDVESLRREYPALGRIMLGRGITADPALARQVRGGPPLSGEELHRFHEALLLDYTCQIRGEVNVLHKMKELWTYWIRMFPGEERRLKTIQKARTLLDLRRGSEAIFAACRPAETPFFGPAAG